MGDQVPTFDLQRIRTRVRIGLGIVVGVLFVAYLVTQGVLRIWDHDLGGDRYGFVQLFDLSKETNIPTAFSSFLLLSCSMMTFVLGAVQRSDDHRRRFWMVFGSALLFVSFDEAAELHERWSFVIWKYVETDGVLHDAWLIPYIVLALLLGAYLVKFIIGLPTETRNRFIAAGSIYIGAAVVMEMIEGYYETKVGYYLDDRYAILVGIEEVLELLAMIMFLDALFLHLTKYEGVTDVALLRDESIESAE